ncbi:MAG TPA: hypothetical protein VNE62_05215 [Actinomycetota bacterium]|nr:hypothetical protein [Actinomycetota bacterium]
MRKHHVAAALVMALAMSGCAGQGAESEGGDKRTVLADYSHDEFASFFLDYFPGKVSVRPGDTVEFRQTWTGEAHSVTMGTLVDHMMSLVKPYKEAAERGEEIPDEEPPEVAKAFEELPWMFEDEGSVAQNAAVPCYLREGSPPKDANAPCEPNQRKQPAFDGRFSYYNSGFIPYTGAKGNIFRVKMAEDIKPGTYSYYCNLHGPFMSGDIEVKPKSASIPSQEQVNRQARREIQQASAPLKDIFGLARKGKPVEVSEGVTIASPFSGLGAEKVEHAGINEFIPKTLKVKAGEKVSWKFVGYHTISFNVPRYFPIIETSSKTGKVTRNPKLDPPAGGAPKVELPDFDAPKPEGPPQPKVVDAGTWNGKGFYSSGLIGSPPYLEWSLRITKPGKYRYACLVHPPMVGTLEVQA